MYYNQSWHEYGGSKEGLISVSIIEGYLINNCRIVIYVFDKNETRI
jgi:hypothetical protein